MKLWIDDLRLPPEGYTWCKTVDQAKQQIEDCEYMYSTSREKDFWTIEVIDTDHDAGDYGPPDYIELFNWLEETGRNYPIRIHSMNPIGRDNIRRIIYKNGWKEIL
jgi:hypothetical protein